MTSQEYRIPERNFGWIQGKIAVLNKRAEKLGVPLIEMRIVGEEMRQVAQRGRDLIERSVEAVEGFSGVSRSERFYTVVVSGDAPVLNGWAFVATLQHVAENGSTATIILAVPGQTVPEQYRATDGNWCDHCRTRRYRTDTFIVKNVQPTINMDVPVIFKQVGRQCLKDFLGHVNPHKLADWATELGLLDQLFRGAETDDRESGGRRDWRYINTSMYMAYVAESIARYGWLARGKARDEGGVATADRALMILEDDTKARIVPTKANIELAKAALAWARESLPEMVQAKPDNDFLYNLATVTRLEYLGEKMLGSRQRSFRCTRARTSHLRRAGASTSASSVSGPSSSCAS